MGRQPRARERAASLRLAGRTGPLFIHFAGSAQGRGCRTLAPPPPLSIVETEARAVLPLLRSKVVRPVRSQAGRAAALALAVAMLAGGCGSPFPRLETPATGRMAVTASLPAAAALSPLQEFEVSLTQGRHVVQKRGPVEGETFAVTLDNLYIGQWEVAVSVWDAEGDAIYTGSGSVWISENETTTVHVPLVPRPGELALTIDISGLPLEEQSYKARLHVSPGGVHNLDRVPGTALFE